MLKEVEDEPRQVIDICHKYGTAVKTNFETDTLTELIDMGIDRRDVGYKSTPVVLGISKK